MPCEDTRGQDTTKSRRMSGTSWIPFVVGFLFITGIVVGLIESHSRVQPKQMQSYIESHARTQVVQRTFDHEYDKADTDAETQEVMVAARDFKEDDLIKADMVKAIRMAKSAVPVGSFSSFKDVDDRWVKTAVLEWQPITENKLGPKGTAPGIVTNIPRGLRGYKLVITEHSGALALGFILPGQRVDVVLYEGKEKYQQRGETILRNILVLAAGRYIYPDESRVQRRSVTFGVRPDQVDSLVTADAKGPLSLRLHGLEAVQNERRVAVASSASGVEAIDAKGGTAEQVQARACYEL